MKDYICLNPDCRKEFNNPKQKGDNESEVFCCPFCGSDNFEVIPQDDKRPGTKPTNF